MGQITGRGQMQRVHIPVPQWRRVPQLIAELQLLAHLALEGNYRWHSDCFSLPPCPIHSLNTTLVGVHLTFCPDYLQFNEQKGNLTHQKCTYVTCFRSCAIDCINEDPKTFHSLISKQQILTIRSWNQQRKLFIDFVGNCFLWSVNWVIAAAQQNKSLPYCVL